VVFPIAAILSTAAALLAGCASSPPSQFYTLADASPASASQASPGATPTIRIAAVHIPPMLDRPEITRRSAGDQLEISGTQRWSAPLDEMVQEILTRDLLERLPSGKVILPSAPVPSGTEAVVVNILQFQSDIGGSVVFEGSWSVVPQGAAAPALVRNFRYTASASPAGIGEEVGAMSTLLGQLADDIARNLPAP